MAVIFLVMIVFLSRGFSPGDDFQKINLEFWGVFDGPDVLRPGITAWQNQNRNVRITYKQFKFEDYEKELMEAFASGRGPDIFMIHNTWLPKHQERITSLPQFPAGQKEPLFTLKDFREQFVEVAENDLTAEGEIYALPLYADSLALYYNRDIFNSLSISQPPQTWEEFNRTVEKITRLGNNDQIIRAGAAIGTVRNINRSTDILSLLMMQSGVPMYDQQRGATSLSRKVGSKDAGAVALEYYTDFANPRKEVFTWDNGQHYSIDAFQEGSAAMMFNYAHQIPVLRSKAPRLNFGLAPMPQLNSDQMLNYANYWAPAVSRFSANSLAAWRFLVFLSSTEGVISYLNTGFHPTARRDLIEAQKTELDIGVFAQQALSARSWYQADNQAIEGVLAEMIESVIFRRATVSGALRTAENKIDLIQEKRR